MKRFHLAPGLIVALFTGAAAFANAGVEKENVSGKPSGLTRAIISIGAEITRRVPEARNDVIGAQPRLRAPAALKDPDGGDYGYSGAARIKSGGGVGGGEGVGGGAVGFNPGQGNKQAE